jgi:hypothetical protein
MRCEQAFYSVGKRCCVSTQYGDVVAPPADSRKGGVMREGVDTIGNSREPGPRARHPHAWRRANQYRYKRPNRTSPESGRAARA